MSGVTESYSDTSASIGFKVVIVVNLKARKIRGQISQGMILSAEDTEGHLKIVQAPKGMPVGSIIA